MRRNLGICTALAALLFALPASAQKMLYVPDNREGWPWGFCTHVVQGQHPAETQQAIDELGAPWVRIDADWNGIEPQQGQFYWDLMDSVVNNARARGEIIYATLAYTPQWATDGPLRSGVPRSPDHYRNFVTAVVGRYKDRVKHWGIWNEPEGVQFWTGSQQQFVDLVLKPGAEAIRAADPGALVLGFDSGNDDWLDAVFKLGGGNYLDVITVHVYACCDNTDDVAKVLLRLDCTGGWPWDKCRKKAIDNNGLGSKPVWVTEVGWKTQTPEWEQKQATLYTQLLDEMRKRSSWWKKTIFYELYDAEPCDPGKDNCWGIIHPDWSRKPAFDAVKQYIVAHQPRAEAGPDLNATAGAPVTFSGAASHDPDGTISKHRWDFDRSDGVTAEASGVSVSHAFTATGDYVVTLVVTDNNGIEDADTLTVHVDPAGQDAGQPDSGQTPDSGTADSSVPDAGAVDAAPSDAGADDVSPQHDAETDAGTATDGGPADAGTTNDGTIDAGADAQQPEDAASPVPHDSGAGSTPRTDTGSTTADESAGGCNCSVVGF
jgi:hypothetical protein